MVSHLNKAQVNARLREICSIETVEVNGELLCDIYSEVPFDGE